MVYTVLYQEYSPADLKDEIRAEIISSMPDLKRGDIVAMQDKDRTYRNDGKAIFDGKDIVSLYDELDEYGSVPPTFFIGDEFPITHWLEDIVHNCIVWIDTKTRSEQLLGLKYHSNATSMNEATVAYPLGTYTIQISKKHRQAYEDHVRSGEPLPVWGVDDSTVIYPWYDGYQ